MIYLCLWLRLYRRNHPIINLLWGELNFKEFKFVIISTFQYHYLTFILYKLLKFDSEEKRIYIYNIYMYYTINSIPFLSNDMLLKPVFCSRTRQTPWILMFWLLALPGHQKPGYWLYDTNTSLSTIRNDYNYQHYLKFEKWKRLQMFHPSPFTFRSPSIVLILTHSRLHGTHICTDWCPSTEPC